MCTDVLMNDYVGRGKEKFTYMYKECKHYTPEWQRQADVAERRQEATQERVEARYNRTARALLVLEVGTRVAVQDSQA